MKELVPVQKIEQLILLIRGQKVILDADLARLYGVTTMRLNEQVKRNRDRFPEDFMFQLTKEEKKEVVANCDILHNLKFRKGLPYVFTEHGALMAASVLNSPRAIEVSIYVIRAFVKLKEIVSTHKELARKLAGLEQEVKGHGAQIWILVNEIQRLMAPALPSPQPKRRRIGFRE